MSSMLQIIWSLSDSLESVSRRDSSNGLAVFEAAIGRSIARLIAFSSKRSDRRTSDRFWTASLERA